MIFFLVCVVYLHLCLNSLNKIFDWGTDIAAKSLHSCLTLCDHIDGSPPGSPVPDSPGKNTGVGCHFLLQCMKVKSEREVAQSRPTLSDPMDCSLPGSSVHGIFQAIVLEWVAIAFSGTDVDIELIFAVSVHYPNWCFKTSEKNQLYLWNIKLITWNYINKAFEWFLLKNFVFYIYINI